MGTARALAPTVTFVDEYCAYRDLFDDVRSFEHLCLLHVGLISDLPRKSLPAVGHRVGADPQALHNFISRCGVSQVSLAYFARPGGLPTRVFGAGRPTAASPPGAGRYDRHRGFGELPGSPTKGWLGGRVGAKYMVSLDAGSDVSGGAFGFGMAGRSQRPSKTTPLHAATAFIISTTRVSPYSARPLSTSPST